MSKKEECPKCNYFEEEYKDVSKCYRCGLGITEKETKEPEKQNYVYEKGKAEKRKENLRFYIEKYLPKIENKNKSLDVGCGNGILPKIMKERSWNAYGIDPFINKKRDKTFCENIESKSLKEFETEEKFRLVTFMHTLEHIPETKKSLKKVGKLLEKGGYVFICVPNFGSYWSKLRGENWRWLNTSEHIYHFTPDSIRRILSKAGFKEIEVYTENKNMRGIVLENLRSLGYLSTNSVLNTILHKGGSIVDPLLKGVVDKYLDRRKKGAELIAIARHY